MALNVRLFDQTIGGPNTGPDQRKTEVAHLTLVADTLTVDEVIASHVTESLASSQTCANPDQSATRETVARDIEQGRVSPGTSLESAIASAQKAFRNGEFLFLWNDRQVCDPDSRLSILGDNEAVFLRLLPMKGG